MKHSVCHVQLTGVSYSATHPGRSKALSSGVFRCEESVMKCESTRLRTPVQVPLKAATSDMKLCPSADRHQKVPSALLLQLLALLSHLNTCCEVRCQKQFSFHVVIDQRRSASAVGTRDLIGRIRRSRPLTICKASNLSGCLAWYQEKWTRRGESHRAKLSASHVVIDTKSSPMTCMLFHGSAD